MAKTTAKERSRRTIANQTNSPLLRLPAEIRNKIYTFALQTSNTPRFPPRPHPHLKKQHTRTPLAICLTSQQLHYETLPIFYERRELQIVRPEHSYDMDEFTAQFSRVNCRFVNASMGGVLASWITLRSGMRGEKVVEGMVRLKRVYVCTEFWGGMSEEAVTRALRVYFQRPELEVETEGVEDDWCT